MLLDVNLNSIFFHAFPSCLHALHTYLFCVNSPSFLSFSRHSYFHMAHNDENFFQFSVVHLIFYCKIRINPQISTFETSFLSADVKDVQFHSQDQTLHISTGKFCRQARQTSYEVLWRFLVLEFNSEKSYQPQDRVQEQFTTIKYLCKRFLPHTQCLIYKHKGVFVIHNSFSSARSGY